jgi:DNA-directed RNA polymerase specialized sigma24 family protein
MSRPDDAELAEFFRREHPTLRKVLLGWGLSLSDAEDVAQTIFTRIFTYSSSVTDKISTGGRDSSCTRRISGETRYRPPCGR